MFRKANIVQVEIRTKKTAYFLFQEVKKIMQFA